MIIITLCPSFVYGLRLILLTQHYFLSGVCYFTQNLPCSVIYQCMLGGSVEVLNKEHSIVTNRGSNSFWHACGGTVSLTPNEPE